LEVASTPEFSSNTTQADQGVGCGPGGPPYKARQQHHFHVEHPVAAMGKSVETNLDAADMNVRATAN
jgi:hypothetical protein